MIVSSLPGSANVSSQVSMKVHPLGINLANRCRVFGLTSVAKGEFDIQAAGSMRRLCSAVSGRSSKYETHTELSFLQTLSKPNERAGNCRFWMTGRHFAGDGKADLNLGVPFAYIPLFSTFRHHLRSDRATDLVG